MKKLAATSIVLICFVIHLLCTVLYNAPANPVTKHYQPLVLAYMEPYFMQKWLLFAPEPAVSDLKLWYRVKWNNTWDHWIDPAEAVLKRHQHNRVTSSAKLLYVYGNIPRDLSMRYEMLAAQYLCADSSQLCASQREDSLAVTSEYKLAMRYAITDFKAGRQHEPNPDSLQLLVIQLYPKQFSERLSAKPFGFASSTEFRPVPFPH
jgi:hypothetical protein